MALFTTRGFAASDDPVDGTLAAELALTMARTTVTLTLFYPFKICFSITAMRGAHVSLRAQLSSAASPPSPP